MTPQEQGMINGLIDRVQKTQLQEKDDDAERLLQQGLGRNPDSLYILSQTVLVQQYALNQAQQQLADLKKQIDQLQSQQQHPKPATSFLGGLFGGGSSDRPASPPPPSQDGTHYMPVPGYASQSNYGQQGYGAAPMYGTTQYGAPPQQGGGFLRGAMQTAAGVAAGALAFEGVESLLHGFGNSMTGMGGSGGRPEEIVNNYYGDESGDHGDRGNILADTDRSQDNNDPGSNVFTDDNDRNNFAASDDGSSSDSPNDTDDSSFSDGGDSDDSSFDDGGDSMSDDSSSDDSY